MNKIVVIVMGQDCEKTISMCLESVKDADAIVYCDGGSIDNTLDICDKFMINNGDGKTSWGGVEIIANKFEQDNQNMIAIQKNFWLDYVKKNYDGWWSLYLDSDEVVDNFSEIKEFVEILENQKLNKFINPRMRHLIGSLCKEDNTKPIHYVANRVFKISNDLYFPISEHTFVQSKEESERDSLNYDEFVIWHLGCVGGIWDAKKRYDGQMGRMSEGSHSEDFLNTWYRCHLFDQYPTKKFNPVELPKIILDYFGIDKDMLYFINQQPQLKHPEMVHQWYDYFKPESVLALGCGRGCYLYFWKWFIPTTTKRFVRGIEISKWAVNNALCDDVLKGDICDEKLYKFFWEDFKGNTEWKTDLITAIDVLEHLDDKQLDKTLKNMSKYGKRFLFSIPFIGDPNLEADNTHKQFHDRKWWIEKINSYGIELEPTPLGWLFHEQLLIGKKK